MENKLLAVQEKLMNRIELFKERARQPEQEAEILVNFHNEIKFLSDLLEIVSRQLETFKPSVIEQAEEPKNKNDMVNSPNHYKKDGLEVIDVIKTFLSPIEFRGYIKGNDIKYVLREADKNGDEDLAKAEFYLKYLRTGKKGLDK